MDADQYRSASRTMWCTVAPGWERWRQMNTDAMAGVRDRLVADLDPQPGQTVLELSAGIGDTGFAVAPLLGEHGRLITSDLTSEMLASARRRGAELAPAQRRVPRDRRRAHPLGDDAVAASCARTATCCSPTRRPPSPRRGACCGPAGGSRSRSGRRPTTTPGARWPAGCWSSAGTCRRRSPARPAPSPSATTTASAPCSTTLASQAERVEPVEVRFVLASLEEWERWAIEATSIGEALRGVPEDERAAIRAEIAAAYAPYTDAAGRVVLPGLSNVWAAS
jgi:hypothetical protein